MVLPSLFNKSSSKKPKHHDSHSSHPAPPLNPGSSSHPHSHSRGATPPSSPEKKSYHKFQKDRERRSNSYSSKRSSRYDHDSHPLNLPPDELRRLSASMTDQPTPQPMDLDRDFSSLPAPSSPAVAQAPNGFNKNAEQDSSAAPPPPVQGPAPPPHRYATSPPPQSQNVPPKAPSPPPGVPTITAEEYKTAGNKFFKAKEYNMAIKEYSKGMYNGDASKPDSRV
jgi:DnaJ homolog subfamily C member 7